MHARARAGAIGCADSTYALIAALKSINRLRGVLTREVVNFPHTLGLGVIESLVACPVSHRQLPKRRRKREQTRSGYLDYSTFFGFSLHSATMVRVKFRYLVVNFLYPQPSTTAKNGKNAPPLPDLVQIHSPTPDALHQGSIMRMVRDGVEELYGDYGAGMISAGLKVNYFSPSTSTAIIRCPRDHYAMVWAALTFITHLPTKPVEIPVVIRVLRVSGTIKKAEEEVIRRSKIIVKRAKAWEGKETLPMVQSVEKAVEKARAGEVLVEVESGSEDGMSE
ncbi:hypothetical protein NX059_000733 [Plenodomus lindquistii]|nr:hypothetical protein NX059_000733 [Plenodomus lindquistii]